MAVIKISENRSWGCARWLFLDLLEWSKESFPVDSHLRESVDIALANDLGWLDLSEMSGDQLQLFQTGVIKAFDDLKRKGPVAWGSPEFYSGAMKLVSELIALLDGEKT
jgi:hypothetical protein